jgi:DMSO reductase anchor subunit
MTVSTQLSVFGFVAAWLLSLFLQTHATETATMGALIVGLLSFGVSPLHLGRPAFAFRAIRNWKQSWLSREILALTGFGAAATMYAMLSFLNVGFSNVVGSIAMVLGFCGIASTSLLYLVPGRPAWRSVHTVFEFVCTGAVLGLLFVAALGVPSAALPVVAAAAAGGQLINQTWKFIRLTRSEEFEKQASARLLSQEFAPAFMLRMTLLIVGGIVLPLVGWIRVGFVIAIAAEVLGRYLFFVTVVPKNMARTYFEHSRMSA